jgi:hypothetical protein
MTVSPKKAFWTLGAVLLLVSIALAVAAYLAAQYYR